MVHQRRRRSRRARLGAVALATGALTVTAACTSDSEPPSAAPSRTSSSAAATPSPSASDAPVTLRFAVYGDRQQLASYRSLARAYEQRNPTVTVQVETADDESTGDALQRRDARSHAMRRMTQGTA